MPTDVDELIQLFCHLSKQKNMKAVVKSGRLRNAGALIGVLLGGLFGLVVGLMAGDYFSNATADLKPVPEILLGLPPDKKKKLCDQAMVILCTFHWSGLPQLISLVMENATLQQKLIALLRDYFSKELRAEIQYRE